MKLQSGDKIVFAGDSTTDADKQATYDGLGTGYVKLVRDELVAFYPQEVYRIFNAGVSGNTSRDLLARWEKDVSALEPDVVFCMIGINDVWRHFDSYENSDAWVSVEEFASNLGKICKMGKQAREFCLITPFFMEANRADDMRAMTDRYTQELRRVAAEYKAPVLDVQAEFDAYMKSRSGISISWDRVHPGAVGSQILARAVLKYCGK